MTFVAAVFFLSLAVLVSAQSNDTISDIEPSEEYLPPPAVAEVKESAKLADNGYEYRTVRKLKYRARHRRNVSPDYLPPLQEKSLQEYLPPPEEKSDTKLADDGYLYKTVRKLKYRARQRRDVNDIKKSLNDYLPPVDVDLAPDLKTILGDDGYRYKTVRSLKYKRHRREAADGEYLPPTEKNATYKPDDAAVEIKSAELADDGYRYKTVRRLKYRSRH